jgi:hypothetical protein
MSDWDKEEKRRGCRRGTKAFENWSEKFYAANREQIEREREVKTPPARADSDPDLHALLALHRGELGIVAEYVKGLARRFEKTGIAVSTLYAIADMFNGAPNVYHHISLSPNKKIKALDKRLTEIFTVGRWAAQGKGGGDAVESEYGIGSTKGYELSREYKQYEAANAPPGKRFKLIKRRRRKRR